MKLLSYLEGDRVRVGLLSGDGSRVMALPVDDMISLIAGGSIPQPSGSGVPLTSVRLLAPIPRPRKNVFCVGWNYLAHFEEGKQARPNVEMPEYPTFFTKAPTTVNGPCDPIPYDARISTKLDWEVELGVVIGRGGKNITESEAMGHVFGYTIINDLSWRDLQQRHGQQWFKGKSLDGTCPMGPWIVTRDEIDAANLHLELRVNGVVKQRATTAQMYFKLPRIIAELSLGLTLDPGDIIATGTPSGVGHRRTPPEFLKPGDVVEAEVSGIGTVRNTIG